MFLFASARRRVRSIVLAFDAQYANAEAALAAEEAAIEAASEPGSPAAVER
jgi:hypothetical protein